MRSLLIALLLIGCSQEKPKEVRVRQEVKASAPTTIPVNGNQIVVVEIPSKDGKYTDIQKCYVWRDAEFKTSSMSCPSEQTVESPGVLGTPERSNY